MTEIHKTLVIFDKEHKTITVTQNGVKERSYDATINSLAEESDMVYSVLKASAVSFSKYVQETVTQIVVTYQYV